MATRAMDGDIATSEIEGDMERLSLAGTEEEKEHSRNLTMRTWKMYTEQKHCDFTLRIGKYTRHCHKTVLCAESEHFDALCASGEKEAIVNVPISSDLIEQLIRFLYLGSLELDQDNISQVLAIADAVKWLKLTARCEQYIVREMNVENLSKYGRLADQYVLGSVQAACKQVARDNFGHLMHSTDFLPSLTADELAIYLQDNALNVECEEDVLHAIILWLETSHGNIQKKEHALKLLLPTVRLAHCNKGRLQALMKDAAFLAKEFKLKMYEHLFQHDDAEPTQPRSSYAAYRDRIVIVCGRKSGEPVEIETGEIRFLENGREDTKVTDARMLAENSFHHSITMHDNTIVISGGFRRSMKKSVREVHRYNLLSGTWDQLVEMPRGRDSHVTACSDKQMIVMAGCYREPWDSIQCHYTEVDVLDMNTLQWSQRAAMPYKVRQPGLAVVRGDLIVMGGDDQDGRTSLKTYKYDVVADRWSTCRDMPENIAYFVHSSVVVDTKVYVLAHTHFLVYDVPLDTWSRLSAHPRPSHWCAMVIHSNKLVSLGGNEEVPENPHGDVHSYDISKNRWMKEEASMPVPLSFHAAFSVQLPKSLNPAH